MRVNVLGTFEVLRDGVPVVLSAPKLQCVLSLMALQANSVVPTHQLIEELWEDNPPDSVSTTLQTYIYQLRKRLRLEAQVHGGRPHGQPPEPGLHTCPTGYLLALPPECLDAARFERTAEQGRAELEAGAVERAAVTLSEALRTWRGPALVDVSQGPVLQAEVLRLAEIRGSTLDRRMDADLRLGRHQQLVGELTGQVLKQPTHEGLQAKLMLALYRAGRRSESLQVYQRARAALGAELGLAPSAELQRLHQAVLEGAPQLDFRPGRDSGVLTAAAAPPAQLPPEGPALVGRERALATVVGALAEPGARACPVVVVTGPPGAGKTAFCVAAAHAVRPAYPDGQFHATMVRSDGLPVDPGEVLARFLVAAGVGEDRLPASTDERAKLFRTWAANRRCLVVLDDVVSDEQVLPLLPSNRECAVVVAGRRRPVVPVAAAEVDLEPLDERAAEAALVKLSARRPLRAELPAVATISRLCGGLPAALQGVGRELRRRPHWTLSRFAERLVGQPSDPGVEELAASVRKTCRVLPGAARDAFGVLAGAVVAPVSAAEAALLLGTTHGEAETSLEDLVEYRLMDGIGEDRYRFLPAIQAVGRNRAFAGNVLAGEPAAVRVRVVPAG